jgi:hypothetical protein
VASGFPEVRQTVLDAPDARALAEFYRGLALGGRLLNDRSGDPEEPLRIYADPAGHPFCIFVAPG